MMAGSRRNDPATPPLVPFTPEHSWIVSRPFAHIPRWWRSVLWIVVLRRRLIDSFVGAHRSAIASAALPCIPPSVASRFAPTLSICEENRSEAKLG